MPGLDRVSVHFDDQGVLKRLLSLTPVLPPFNIFSNVIFVTRVGHNAVSLYSMNKRLTPGGMHLGHVWTGVLYIR